MTATNWTKADIKVLCGALDTFALENRNTDDAQRRVRERLQTHRADVVLAELRRTRDMHAHRYVHNCQTIGNQLARFTEYGKPDELIERFTRLAREEDAAAKKADALVLRVVREGLPPEVIAYDPFTKVAAA